MKRHAVNIIYNIAYSAKFTNINTELTTKHIIIYIQYIKLQLSVYLLVSPQLHVSPSSNKELTGIKLVKFEAVT